MLAELFPNTYNETDSDASDSESDEEVQQPIRGRPKKPVDAYLNLVKRLTRIN